MLASLKILIKEPTIPFEVLHFTILVWSCHIMLINMWQHHSPILKGSTSLFLCATMGTFGIREATWSKMSLTPWGLTLMLIVLPSEMQQASTKTAKNEAVNVESISTRKACKWSSISRVSSLHQLDCITVTESCKAKKMLLYFICQPSVAVCPKV